MHKLRNSFGRELEEQQNVHKKNYKILRDQLDLQRKNELHLIEERKNTQINTLMQNHEKSYSEMKNYYNDITLNNLALINSLKVKFRF